MRQLLPTRIDQVDPAGAYADLPGIAHRPAVRLNMIASVDGATAVGDVSGGLGREELTHHDLARAVRRRRKNSRAVARWSMASSRSLKGRTAPSKEVEFHSPSDGSEVPGDTT